MTTEALTPELALLMREAISLRVSVAFTATLTVEPLPWVKLVPLQVPTWMSRRPSEPMALPEVMPLDKVVCDCASCVTETL